MIPTILLIAAFIYMIFDFNKAYKQDSSETDDFY